MLLQFFSFFSFSFSFLVDNNAATFDTIIKYKI